LKRFRFLVVLVSVTASLVWLGFRFWPSNENVVESRLHDLAETLSYTKPEGVVRQSIRVHRLVEFFTADLLIDLSGVSMGRGRLGGLIQGRDGLSLSLRAMPEEFRSLNVEFVDVLVKMAPDQSSATAFASALITAEMDRSRLRETTAAQELKFELKRNGATWEIVRVVTYRTLQ
jgi:hypothetical protein